MLIGDKKADGVLLPRHPSPHAAAFPLGRCRDCAVAHRGFIFPPRRSHRQRAHAAAAANHRQDDLEGHVRLR